MPPPGCHLSVCSPKLVIVYSLSCLSVCLPTRIHPHIHPFVCLPICLLVEHPSVPPSAHLLPSIHPSIRVHLPIHPLSISQLSICKPAHAPSHHSPTSLSVHPHGCADALSALQSIHPSPQPPIHLSVQPAIRHIQEDTQSGHNSSTSPGKAETWNPTHWAPKPAPPLASRVTGGCPSLLWVSKPCLHMEGQRP